jgi:hypothetical protein
MASTWHQFVPFSKDGKRMLSYVYDNDPNDKQYDWRPNYQFVDVLTIKSYYKGRSAFHITVVDSHNVEYSMFLSDFMWTAVNLDIKQGHMNGTWTFKKKGSNYGICHI